MEFIQILLSNSQIKEAKLFNAAKKASVNPEIGITIQNPAAHHVIKDCANITLQYLPMYVFGAFQTPFVTLKGKFKKEHIIDLISHSKTSYPLEQLVCLIVSKAEKEIGSTSTTSGFTQNNKIDPMDPYGDYEVYVEDVKPDTRKLSTEDLLCKAFGVS